MKKDKSCGAIIFRDNNGIIEYLLVQQRKGEHRSFPKGHIESGESETETALREIYEEIGINVDFFSDFREVTSYIDYTKPANKTVVFFLAKVDFSNITISHELLDFVRLPYSSAYEKLTYDDTKEILKKAYEFLEK